MLKQATIAAQSKPADPTPTTSSAPVSSIVVTNNTSKSAPPSARSKTPRGCPDTAGICSAESPTNEPPDPMTLATDEELVKQIDYLKELNMCLDELAESEAREETLGAQLQEHEHAFQSLMDQHTMLYAHFFHMHSQYAAAEAKLRRERDQLEASSRELEIKCQRLEAGMHAIGGLDTDSSMNEDVIPSDAQLKAQVTHLTRQMASYEVNDARWKRTCRLLQDELRASERRNAILANEWLDMEKTLKFRIMYLESWKQGAGDMMERMDKVLGASILKEAADRQQHALVDVLCKYRDVSSAYADVRVKYLELYDLPMQLSKTQHSLKLLEAEKRARDETLGNGGGTTARKKQYSNGPRAGSIDSVMQARISELELELKHQVERVKELELERAKKFEELEDGDNGPQNWQKTLVVSAIGDGDRSGSGDNVLVAENELLYERINEVEQLYEALTRECTKYKDVATLAASQANLLSKKLLQTQRERQDESTRRRQLASASEDQALVGHLQLELMQLRTTYQQFALKHDLVIESQQRALLERQQVELEAEKSAKELVEVREFAREKVNKLEAALTQVSTRDLTARNAKWDAFRKRLDTLEDDLRAEHSRRKQLELELEEKMQRSVNTSGTGASVAAMTEVNRLRTRVEELETRERALIAQLEALSAAASNSARAETREHLLEAELVDTKALNEDLLRQIQSDQSRMTSLLEQLGALERDHRELRSQKEDVELELRQRLQQLECEDNQRQHSREEGSPRSPLMRKKVGLYEQDQAQLQQAAQATIASLKQLVEDKNELVREYQQKLASVRAEVAQSKAQDRVDASKLHKQLYEENQRVIAQLQDATATIRQLERSGKDKRALQAAQERHEQVLRSWKQSEMALEEARQKIHELQAVLETTINERDLAEARAGEALEEIVTLQINAEERTRIVSQLEQRIGAARGEMRKKDDKLQLLRDAIIKLKEEFLKAEDRHAVELARAQHALTASQLDRGRRKKKEEAREVEQDAWQDEKQHLEAQVKILQDKLSLERSRSGRKPRQQRSGEEEEKQNDGDDKKAKKLEAEMKVHVKEAEVLKRELERLKTTVKDQAVSHARTVEELEKKLKVMQAQNAALREAAKPMEADAANSKEESRLREELEATEVTVSKLKRRVDTLTIRLKELQEAISAKDEELSASKLLVERLEKDLKRRRELPEQVKRSANDPNDVMITKWKAQVADLERQNAFLQETLVLKRNEWEDTLRDQMERYEMQVNRLRQRLARQLRDGDDSSVSDSLRREESQFLASQALREELTALGEELRMREQQSMAKDTKLLELELELETLRVECQRLQRLSSLPKRPTESEVPSSKPRPNRPAAAKSDLHERAALEQLIENMKKVIEKLRGDNDRLRRSAASSNASFTPEQMERMRKQLREHKEARGRFETQVEQLQRELNDLKRQKVRLQQKLRAATAPAPGVDRRLEDKDAQLRVTERALTEANEIIEQKEGECRRLQDEYDSLRLELQSPVTSGGRDKQLIEELQDQVATLEDENTRLTNELAAFDSEFFEEIEDLKYKYAQAVRDKRALERELQRLS